VTIDAKTAESIAALARLESSDRNSEKSSGENTQLLSEFNKIVAYMDILSEANTEGVEPMYSPMLEPIGPRADVPRSPESLKADDILDGAPERVERFFSVPRIF
jgi:aspartyl-tRNA(Asn)/glutamyl-tRNA(Gln) amidotransferase subunit C